MLSFGLVVAFFVYLGNRLRLVSDNPDRSPNSTLLIRIGEIFSYCLAGLLVTVLMFLTMEFSSAASYAGVVRTVFIILQVITGLVAGLGGIVGGIAVITLGLVGLFKGGRDGKK